MKNPNKSIALVITYACIIILLVIMTVCIACIIVLRTMPDSIGAYYVRDLIEITQGRLGIGGS